jgi:DNA replication protein DnaC
MMSARVSISPLGAMYFFQLMSRRYEHASTVLTSNGGFEQWSEILRTTSWPAP